MATAFGVVGIVGILLMPVYAFYFTKKANQLHL